MEDCAPTTFLRNWVLVALYLCFRFCIFNKPVLEKYFFQVEGGPQLLQSCLHGVRNGLPLIVWKMHLFFESLAIIGTPCLGIFYGHPP